MSRRFKPHLRISRSQPDPSQATKQRASVGPLVFSFLKAVEANRRRSSGDHLSHDERRNS
jgi:hypothetical protein